MRGESIADHSLPHQVRLNGLSYRPILLGTSTLLVAAIYFSAAVRAQSVSEAGATSAPALGTAQAEGNLRKTAPMEDDLRRKRFENICSECHDTGTVFGGGRRPLNEWKSVVEEMVAGSVSATPADAGLIYKYLVQEAGIVFVNSAAAADIADVLRLSPAEGEAIVRYRQATGTFADFTALSKVRGVSASKLEDKKDAISFRRSGHHRAHSWPVLAGTGLRTRSRIDSSPRITAWR